jgi:hypothetical protein
MATPLTIAITPGYTWTTGEVVTEDKLNLAANPIVSLYGTIGSTSIGDGSVTTAKLADGAVTTAKLAATLDLSGKTLTLPAASVTYANLEADFIGDAPAKATPVLADILLIADSADSNLTKRSTIAQTRAAGRYQSAETAITAGSMLVNEAHNLGSTPTRVSAVLKCTDAGGDLGYAQNDEVHAPTTLNSDIAQFSYGANTTNAFIACGVTPALLNKTTFAYASITPSKWRVILRAEL